MSAKSKQARRKRIRTLTEVSEWLRDEFLEGHVSIVRNTREVSLSLRERCPYKIQKADAKSIAEALKVRFPGIVNIEYNPFEGVMEVTA